MTIILVPYLGSIFRTTDAPVFDAGLQWITRHGAKENSCGILCDTVRNSLYNGGYCHHIVRDSL